MQKTKILTSACILMIVASVPAFAVERLPAQKTPAKAAQASVNPANNVTRDTFLTRGDGEFKAIDADKDGNLTEAEIQNFGTNVSRTRATAQNQNLFKRLDSDKNGSISAKEFEQLVPKNFRIDASPMMKGLDENKDKKISAKEFRSGRNAQFTKMDANGDGIMTQQEFTDFQKKSQK